MTRAYNSCITGCGGCYCWCCSDAPTALPLSSLPGASSTANTPAVLARAIHYNSVVWAQWSTLSHVYERSGHTCSRQQCGQQQQQHQQHHQNAKPCVKKSLIMATTKTSSNEMLLFCCFSVSIHLCVFNCIGTPNECNQTMKVDVFVPVYLFRRINFQKWNEYTVERLPPFPFMVFIRTLILPPFNFCLLSSFLVNCSAAALALRSSPFTGHLHFGCLRYSAEDEKRQWPTSMEGNPYSRIGKNHILNYAFQFCIRIYSCHSAALCPFMRKVIPISQTGKHPNIHTVQTKTTHKSVVVAVVVGDLQAAPIWIGLHAHMQAYVRVVLHSLAIHA